MGLQDMSAAARLLTSHFVVLAILGRCPSMAKCPGALLPVRPEGVSVLWSGCAGC